MSSNFNNFFAIFIKNFQGLNMGRNKTKRILNFKPFCKEYGPKCRGSNGLKKLFHEEIEALYLMDILNMYQKDAALKMGVSRPTFTRIVKNARVKLTSAIISGYELKIEDLATCCNIAICSDKENIFINTTPLDKYIYIYKVDNKKTILKEILINPANQINRPAHIFPNLFIEKNINLFISSKIQEGLKYALISKGIESKIVSKFSKDELQNLLKTRKYLS